MLSWIEINKANVCHNIKAFRKILGDDRLLMPVIKANAYGHGIIEVGKICDNEKEVDMLCVASLNEALQLREHQINKPILILSYYDLDYDLVKRATQSNITFPIYTTEQVLFLNKVGESLKTICRVHLKIDTGTSRVGVKIDELSEFLVELKKCSYVAVEGLWSHFSSSESNSELTKKQLSSLIFAESICRRNDVVIKLKHMACTAASTLHSSTLENGIRLGLGLYGLYPAPATRKRIKLKPVMSLKTTIIQVKSVAKGTKISYGGTYTMPHQGTIAVLPIGYGDGYNRALSNKSSVLIKGVRCPVRGKICMNMMMVEVTKVKNCKAGDTVTLIGKDKNDEMTIDELTKLLPGVINYEIPTSLSPLIPRKVV
jgi:alanine racemase